MSFGLETWAAISVIGSAILVVQQVFRKVILPMWRAMRTRLRQAATLIDQLTGDRVNGVPSLMEQVADVRNQIVEVRAEVAEVKQAQLDHLQWHPSPGGRPAAPTRQHPNGPRPGPER